MRRPGTRSQQRTHLPTRTVRTAIVCLPASTTAADLPDRATAVLAARGLATAGVLPHFANSTRRPGRLVDCWRGRTSGGPVKLLDFDAMRRAAVTTATGEWVLWQQIVAGTKPANPFWWYADKHTADPDRYPIAAAQSDFRAQPRILAMTAYNALPHRPQPLPTAAIEALQAGHTTYLNLAWLAAVPGDALATQHGGWLSTRSQRLADQLSYLTDANAHLAGPHRDTWLLAVASPL